MFRLQGFIAQALASGLAKRVSRSIELLRSDDAFAIGRSLACASLLLMAAAVFAADAQTLEPTPGAPSDHWFNSADAPATTSKATAPGTMDTAPGKGESETVVVIARRRDRSWRSQITEQLNKPMDSDAARHDSFAKPKSYCNSALRTVGGQPASPADMVAGVGAGGC